MSWFNSSGFASLAKSALSQAQKTIDKALDIQVEKDDTAELQSKSTSKATADDNFFAAFGLEDSGGVADAITTTTTSTATAATIITTTPTDDTSTSIIVTPQPAKHDPNVSSVWGSFTGSFFEAGQTSRNLLSSQVGTESTVPPTSPSITSRAALPREKTNTASPSRRDRVRTKSSGTDSRRMPADETASIADSLSAERRNSEVATTASRKSGPERATRAIVTSLGDYAAAPSDSFVSESFGGSTETGLTDVSDERLTNRDLQFRPISVAPKNRVDDSAAGWSPIDLQVPQDVCSTQTTNSEQSVEAFTTNLDQDAATSLVWESNWDRWTDSMSSSGPQISGGSSTERQASVPASGWSELQDVVEESHVAAAVLASSTLSAGSVSVSSAGSTSITDGSSTMDESVGNMSSVSEYRDGRSSATLTPDVLTPDALGSDSGESCVPVGMSSSWDMSECVRHASNVATVDSGSKLDDYPRVPEPSSEAVQPQPDLDTTLTEDGDQEVEEQRVGGEAVSWNCTPPGGAVPDRIFSDVGSASAELESPHRSPSSSSDAVLVSKMLRDAMAESVSLRAAASARAHSPTSTASSSSTNAERSDPTKAAESEQNSGHTSGDELETTASSDIEIISSPSCCGDSGWERGGSQSPLKPGSMWRTRTRTIGHSSYSASHQGSSIRSDSPVSDTSSNRDGVLVPYAPIIRGEPGQLLGGSDKKGKHQRKVSEGSSEDSDSNSLKCEALVKKVMELSTILEARETRMLELSRENCGLREECDKIKAQLHKTEELHAADVRDSSSMTREFTERLSSTEKKLHQTIKERDILMRELQQSTVEVASRVSAVQVEEVKKEKDTQIAELMLEGGKLQKELLIKSNNVKKLRAKEKDNENHIKHQREKIEEQSRELDRVRKAIGAKEEVEKNQIELIRQLTNTVQKYEKEISSLKSDLEDVQEKQRSSQLALDNAYRELGELHRKNAAKDTQAQEAALSAEMVAKEELKATLASTEASARLEQELLLCQIEDLRESLAVVEDQSSKRENTLKQEIATLQKRMQEAEAKNEDLNESVTAATRPLLRQIASLQSSLNHQATLWEKVEGNLSEKLSEALSQVSHATEKERSMSERYAETSSKSASLEMQVALLKQEQSRLQSKLDASNKELQQSLESKTMEIATLKLMKQSATDELSRCKRQQEILEHQLEVEKTALEAEKRRTALLHDQLKEKNFKLQQMSNADTSRHSSPSPRSSVSTMGSVTDIGYPNWYQDDVCDNGLNLNPGSNIRMNVYESLRAGSTASLLDSLQSQLKLRDGDIVQLQNDIAQTEKVKQNMTQELVGLVTQNDQLQNQLTSLQSQAAQFQEMEKKYNALLQMYGEKSEEAQELRLDLQDVKEMYKLQIDELLERK